MRSPLLLHSILIAAALVLAPMAHAESVPGAEKAIAPPPSRDVQSRMLRDDLRRIRTVAPSQPKAVSAKQARRPIKPSTER